MHEVSLVRSLLKQVECLRREQGAARVLTIRLSIGEFSGAEPELIRSAFDELAHDTPIRGAALLVERVPLEARCETCRHAFRVERFRFECPLCGHRTLAILRGEELLLESVTLESAHDTTPEPG